MNWWGKLIGGTFGFMFGGPLGALLGAALGHQYDLGHANVSGASYGAFDQARTQAAFFTATFSIMGYIAKCDGRVSEDEIDMARQVMLRMQLDDAQRETAVALFAEGKAADFPFEGALEQFRRECHRSRNLMRMFLEIQFYAAYADGVLHPAEENALRRIVEALGFSEFEYRQIKDRVASESAAGYQPARDNRQSLSDAYATLGISQTADVAEIKKAYRRLMNQHHPDKLLARGLPEEMVKLATEKTHVIRAAYDSIRKAREF